MKSRQLGSWSRWGALALVCLAACSPAAEPDEAEDPGDGVVRDQQGNIVSYKSVTVHVAGLRGQNLRLLIDDTQQLAVPSDGIWRVPLGEPVPTVFLSVGQQPDSPKQRCDVTKLEENIFTVICRDQTWDVSGTIEGYEGKGLQLALFDDAADDADGSPHSVLNAATSGAFTFPRALADDVNYEVRVLAQPTSPRQDCVVENPEGFADGGDITDVKVSCKTKTYVFTAVVTGLQGSGLTIKTEVGEFPVVDRGTTTYSEFPVPDGYHWKFEVGKQPTNPDQVCYVQNAEGTIDGANATYGIICGAQDNVRIAEIGACPFSSSSCWFEIFNIGDQPENLAFYKLRTSAISPAAFVPSRVFALPSITIPPFGRVVLQGKTPGSMADGQGVYHVGDGTTVPWWGADGFVELLNPAGATADFMRFGANTIAPTTGGIWAGGACPALPRGAGAFGRSLQHVRGRGSSPRVPQDFSLRAFATYAGLNDIESDIDNDSDGIPDVAETEGATFSGLSLYGMGARPNQRDVFIEIDYMAGGDVATLPRKEALDRVVEAFRLRNIALHFDVGNLFSPAFNPELYNLGGGNQVPFATAVGLAPADSAIANMYDIKATNMAGNRRMIFYYQLFGWSQQKDGSGGSSGVGEMPGNDSIVTLGGFGLTANNAAQRNLVANYQAATVMHELGHNFGLRHGGGDAINRKPNYVSVMNYLYSPLGLPTIGAAEGDRYDFYRRCSLSSVTQLTNAPSADPAKFVLDFSAGSSTNLDENALRESVGLGRVTSSGVDFNCNKQLDSTAYSRDLNGDGALDLLADNNDWSALDFVFRRQGSGAENGPSLLSLQERDDILTDDDKHRTDEVCPPPFVEDLSALP
ncbi:MAG: hypothetical protein ABW352_16365 [Polyangiales bacterium]